MADSPAHGKRQIRIAEILMRDRRDEHDGRRRLPIVAMRPQPRDERRHVRSLHRLHGNRKSTVDGIATGRRARAVVQRWRGEIMGTFNHTLTAVP